MKGVWLRETTSYRRGLCEWERRAWICGTASCTGRQKMRDLRPRTRLPVQGFRLHASAKMIRLGRYLTSLQLYPIPSQRGATARICKNCTCMAVRARLYVQGCTCKAARGPAAEGLQDNKHSHTADGWLNCSHPPARTGHILDFAEGRRGLASRMAGFGRRAGRGRCGRRWLTLERHVYVCVCC